MKKTKVSKYDVETVEMVKLLFTPDLQPKDSNYADGTEIFKDILRSKLKSMYTTRELKEMVANN